MREHFAQSQALRFQSRSQRQRPAFFTLAAFPLTSHALARRVHWGNSECAHGGVDRGGGESAPGGHRAQLIRPVHKTKRERS
jgi:hypothetical protein